MTDDFIQQEWSEWDDDPDEEELPEDDDSTDVVTCSSCGGEVYEDAVQCPLCGEYIIHGSHSISGKPLWFVLLGLAGIIAVILILSGLF
jgi:formylmethanofuran dehydrogenase subunit E